MIIIAPFAQKLKNGNWNPKSPSIQYWKNLVSKINNPIIQVGVDGEEQLVPDFRKNLCIPELQALLSECDAWIGVDSFFQHLAWQAGKRGIVLWSVSNPKIFGHPENVNLLKDDENMVKNQFLWWENVPHSDDNFVDHEDIFENMQAWLGLDITKKI